MAASNVATIKISGDVKGALAALDSLGIKAEATGLKVEDAFGDRIAGKVESTGNVFSRFGNMLGSLGLPFGETFEKMGEKIEGADTEGKKFAATMTEVGKVATVALAGGAIVAGREVIKLAESYQQTEAAIAASAGISTKSAQAIGNAFLATAGKTTFSAQTIGQAYSQVAGQLGTVEGHALNAKEAMTVMQASMDLAEATGSSLGSTTGSLAQIMQAFALKTTDASKASDVLFNTSRATGNSIQTVTQTMTQLKMRLGAAAPDMADLGGLMVDLASHGVAGSRGVRTVTQSITGLLSPSTSAQKALAAMGVNLFDAQGKFIGIGPALDALRSGFAKLPPVLNQGSEALEKQNVTNEIAQLGLEKQTPAIAAQVKALKQQQLTLTEQGQAYSQSTAEQALFGKNAQMLLPIIDGGSASFSKYTDQVNKTGTAHEAAEKQASTFKGTLEKLEASGEDMATKLGIMLIPWVQKFGQVIANVTGFLLQHKAVLAALAVLIGGTLATAVGFYAVSQFMKLGTVIQNGLKDFQSLYQGIASLGPKIVGLFQKEGEAMAEASDQMRLFGEAEVATEETGEATGFGLGPIGMVIGAVIIAVVLLATHWHDVMTHLKQWAEDVWTWIKEYWPYLLGILTGPFGLAVAAIYMNFNTIERFVMSVVGSIERFFEGIPGAIYNGAIAPIVNSFAGLPGQIMNVLSGLWDDFLNLGENLVNAIIQGIENMGSGIWDAIKSHIPGSGIVGSALHAIGLAEGGIVTKPTLAMVGEAGYPEAVIPLKNGAGVMGAFDSGVLPLPSFGGASTTAAGMTNNFYFATQADAATIAKETTWQLSRLI